jgi:8-oxo-dGTP diphosphatase
MENKFGVAIKALIRKGDRYLMIYKSDKEDMNPNTIDRPGGRIEFGEKIEDALKREVKEEVGIEIEIKKPLNIWGFVKGNLHLVGITFLAEYKSGEIILSGEHVKFEWLKKEHILNGKYPDWLKEELSKV